MSEPQRSGVLVSNPYHRLSEQQIRIVDETSREIVRDTGLLCYNEEAADIFGQSGADVTRDKKYWKVRIAGDIIDKALESAPPTVVLGARCPSNRLILDAYEPRVRFASGAETNIWLELSFTEVPNDGKEGPSLIPRFTPRAGTISDLRNAAHLCEHLENLNSFIRCVNIRDAEVTAPNKDVNKFFASFDNTTKHVQGGLTSLDALDDVLHMAELIVGGREAFRENPIISFITCLLKSPLQMVDDTTRDTIAFARRQIPVVISSSPMGGATAPFDEFGMVAQINAEILAGVALTQLVSPGTPVLYGSVPVRTRLDNLNDMYGSPEFVGYNLDCIQMARYYGLPCYSTAGVGDTEEPGIQATAEKMLTSSLVTLGGAQYVHYAFGLLERTNTFSPEQAILDDAHIGMTKYALADTTIRAERSQEVVDLIREVMGTSQKVYMYHLPLPTREEVYIRYPLEDEQGGALNAAHDKYKRILELPRKRLPADIRQKIAAQVPGLLPQALGKENG